MSADEIVNDLLHKAMQDVVTDIYFIPKSDFYIIQARNQSSRQVISQLNSDMAQSLMNVLKFRGGLDIAEKRRPQKGSFVFESDTANVSIRISSIGDYKNRESLVIRLIYNSAVIDTSSDQIVKNLLLSAKKPGMMVFSGPMGSGNTTLMYRIARELSDQKIVMCIEDPIEIEEPEFIQLQVNEQAQMTYEKLIKASLRHRAEVLIIGEIRDKETAKVALQAAMCGYTVLTTIHSKSKFSVIKRMVQLGIDPDEIVNGVNLISYQRLIPTISKSEIFIDSISNSKIIEFLENSKSDNNWKLQLKESLNKGVITKDIYEEYISG
ncbi:competence type IV pilus ATPase ComGA [Lactobacillus terrae]|uniref:competence type IV pilus ATPase ComGA n=1 Tax=Lactobacillus terrae TaxID=2269374 RepID=UPI000C1B7221|nr:competence type IV pilus ATPase ComGA [Lactobacillus terrae]